MKTRVQIYARMITLFHNFSSALHEACVVSLVFPNLGSNFIVWSIFSGRFNANKCCKLIVLLMPMLSRSSSFLHSSSSNYRRSGSRGTRRRASTPQTPPSEPMHMASGRDSLIADLFWTFHGENASKYADVTLVSSDGRNFPCCRGILAARSDYFAKLLFSDSGRSNQANVRVDMPADVLALIVQYLHTGDIASEDSSDRAALDKFLEVTRASHNMGHTAMFADCVRHLLNTVSDNRAMLCPVFEAFFGESSVGDGASLLSPLLYHVRREPGISLMIPDLGASADDLRPPVATGPGVGEPVGVLELSGRALETLVSEDKKAENGGDDVHEEFWFYVIWYWATHGPHSATATSSQDGATDESNMKEMSLETVARRTHATQIIDILDAKRMRVAFLLRVVEPTGLMSLPKLCDGYKAHATRAIRSVDWNRKRLRFKARVTK